MPERLNLNVDIDAYSVEKIIEALRTIADDIEAGIREMPFDDADLHGEWSLVQY